MPKRFYQIPTPSQGWSVAFDDYLTGRNFVTAVSNVRMCEGRLDCGIPMNAGPAVPGSLVPNGGYLYRTGEGDTAALLGTKSGLYRWLPASDSWSAIHGSLTFSGRDIDRWSFAANYDWCYASNRTDGIYRYSGGGLFRLFDTRHARYLEGFAGRLFAADMSDPSSGSFRDRIAWTSIGAHPSFEIANGGGFNDLVDIPGPITGIGGLASSLYAYKPTGIWRIDETGLDIPAFRFRIVHQGIGCIGGYTLTRTPIGHIFLGADLNVYGFNGTGQPQAIGAPVYAWLRDNLNESQIDQAFSFTSPRYNEWWLIVPTASTWGTNALVFNWVTNTWSRVVLDTACSAASVLNRSEVDDTWGYETALEWGSETDLRWGDSLTNAADFDVWLGLIDGTVDEPDFEALTGTSTWSFETSDDPVDRSGFDKTITRVILHGRFDETQTINVKLSTDGGDSWTTPVAQSITGDPDANQRILVNVPRTTGENIRLSLDGTKRARLYSLQFETHDKEEIR